MKEVINECLVREEVLQKLLESKNLPSEIWHYDYGNRAWAFYTKKPALYKEIFYLNDSKVTIRKMVNC